MHYVGLANFWAVMQQHKNNIKQDYRILKTVPFSAAIYKCLMQRNEDGLITKIVTDFFVFLKTTVIKFLSYERSQSYQLLLHLDYFPWSTTHQATRQTIREGNVYLEPEKLTDSKHKYN